MKHRAILFSNFLLYAILFSTILLFVVLIPASTLAEEGLVTFDTAPPVSATDAPIANIPVATQQAAPAAGVQSIGDFFENIWSSLEEMYISNANFPIYVALALTGLALIIFLFIFVAFRCRAKRAKKANASTVDTASSAISDAPQSEESTKPITSKNVKPAKISEAIDAVQQPVEPQKNPELKETSFVAKRTEGLAATPEAPNSSSLEEEADCGSMPLMHSVTDDFEELRAELKTVHAMPAIESVVAVGDAAEIVHSKHNEEKLSKQRSRTTKRASHSSHRAMHTESHVHQAQEEKAALNTTKPTEPTPKANDEPAPVIKSEPASETKVNTNQQTDYNSAASVAVAISSIMASANTTKVSESKITVETDNAKIMNNTNKEKSADQNTAYTIDESSDKPFAGAKSTKYSEDISRYTMQPDGFVNDISRNTQVGFAGGMKKIDLTIEERIPSPLDDGDSRSRHKSVGSRTTRMGRHKK